jgi:hypothetical protein
MRWNVANMVERAIAAMPILMILVSGALTKTGYPNWGLAWIAGICALLIMADLFNHARPFQLSQTGSGASVTNRNTFPDRP